MPHFARLGRRGLIAGLLLLSLANCTTGTQGAKPATSNAARDSSDEPMSANMAAQMQAYEQAARLSDNPMVKMEAQYNRATALYSAGRNAEAIAAYQDFITAWGNNDQDLIPGYVTAAALNIGHVLKRQRNYDLAIKKYDEALLRANAQNNQVGRRHSTSGLLHKGESQIELGQFAAAVDTLRQALNDHCKEPDSAREVNCARAQRSTGWAQQRNNQPEEALASYALVIERYTRSSNPDVRQEVMIAQSRTGSVLVHPLKRYDEGIAAFDAALRTGMAMNTPMSRLWTAYSYLNKGNGLAVQGKRQEALRVYDQIPASLMLQDEPGLVYPLARALLNKAQQMQGLAQQAQALPAYDSALRQLSSPGGEAYPDLIAEAHIGRGRLLSRLQRHDEAIAAFDHVINQYGGSSQGKLRDMASQAASAKAVAYDLKQRRDKLETRISEIDARLRLEDAKAEPARSQGIIALNMQKAVVYTGLGMHEEAASVYDSLVLRFGSSTDMSQRRAVASGHYLKGLLRQAQGQPFEAVRTMRDVIERYGKEQDADIQRTVQQANDWLRTNQRPDPSG